jgi:2-dehydro-3-deoxyglucarate aldolase
MNRIERLRVLRSTLKSGKPSVGSWMQLPCASVAEIMGRCGYDWVAIDLEHGHFSPHQLPDLFRALELGRTLPLARLPEATPRDCKQVLDAGAGGVILPMIRTAGQLQTAVEACAWPPAGKRGVGYSRANLFGRDFEAYREEAQSPLVIAMIEHIEAIEDLEAICKVAGLDALFVGPYDLSASMGITGQFHHPSYQTALKQFLSVAKACHIPSGIHVVQADEVEFRGRVSEGYQFIAFSIDALFLLRSAGLPSAVSQD